MRSEEEREKKKKNIKTRLEWKELKMAEKKRKWHIRRRIELKKEKKKGRKAQVGGGDIDKNHVTVRVMDEEYSGHDGQSLVNFAPLQNCQQWSKSFYDLTYLETQTHTPIQNHALTYTEFKSTIGAWLFR